MTEFKDMRGNIIDVGDTVAFGAGGKHGGLRIGKIVRKELRRVHRYGEATVERPILMLHYTVDNWNKTRKTRVGITLSQSRSAENILKVESDVVKPS